MSAPLWLGNLAAVWMQVAALVAAGSAVAALSRLAAPRLVHAYWRGLLLLCLFLPLLQPWERGQTAQVILGGVLPSKLDPAASVHHFAGLSSAPLVAAVLLAGMACRLAWLGLGLLKLRQHRRASRPIAALPGGIQEIQGRLSRLPAFLLSESQPGPVTFGLRRPVVLLPANFTSMDAQGQRAIVAHELIHVARRDWGFHVAEEIVLALGWFHPAVWWVVNRIRVTREQVVDREVVEFTGARKPYLWALLEIASGSGPGRGLAAPAFLRESRLRERIRMLVREDVMSKRKLALSVGVWVVATLLAGYAGVRAFPLHAAGAAATEESRTAGNPPLKILKKVQPLYPVAAKKAGIQGVVTLQVTVIKDGSVSGVKVLGGDQALVDSAKDAVRQWQFAPLDKGSATTKIEINYSLQDVTKPEPVDRPDPVYPPDARAAKVQGAVKLRITIATDGSVRDVKVLESPDKRLDQSAVDAVRNWKFKPAMKDGKPLEVQSEVEVNFKLY